jgi:predicted RNA-binding Zn-ribbon protein involved in translation (DUF1610 family)
MYIQCQCGAWEEMNNDEQRWHSQYFLFIDIEGEFAVYRCPECGKIIYV